MKQKGPKSGTSSLLSHWQQGLDLNRGPPGYDRTSCHYLGKRGCYVAGPMTSLLSQAKPPSRRAQSVSFNLEENCS